MEQPHMKTTLPTLLHQAPPVMAIESTPSILLPAGFAGTVQPLRVRLHDSWDKLVDHVVRHVLSTEARLALRASFPELTNLDEFISEKAAVRWIRSPGRTAADPVVTAYRMLIERSLAEAWSLRFVVWNRRTAVTIDSSGLLAVVEDRVLKTTFIPAVESAVAAMREDSRSLRRDDRHRQQLDAKRDGNERYYYGVFRPAVQHVRRFPADNVLSVAQYGALKNALPTQKQLGYLSWCAMRSQAGHPEMEFML